PCTFPDCAAYTTQNGHATSGRPASTIAPRGGTGGCCARTQDPWRSGATRGSEDKAQRRQGRLECERICGGGHLSYIDQRADRRVLVDVVGLGVRHLHAAEALSAPVGRTEEAVQGVSPVEIAHPRDAGV